MTTKVGRKLSYDQKTILGRGTFGIVFRGFLKINSSKKSSGSRGSYELRVAVKRFQNSEHEAPLIQREVEIMQRGGDHPNILHYIYTEKNNDFMCELIVTMFSTSI